jgi:NADPH:quinone reductase-like Zn-dependent oxidoreductase
MRAWMLKEFGIEHLQLAERPALEPKTSEVRVAIKAVSLNYRDLMVCRGVYNPRMKLPKVLCSDGVGVVTAVGSGVTRAKVGDRVCGTFMQQWLAGSLNEQLAKSTLGSDYDGVLAEEAILSEEGVIEVPSYLSDEEAATLPCAAVTAWQALAEGGLKAGETVLLQGTGGVSLFALQIAKLFGARVLITSSSDEKLQRAMQLGAEAGLNYRLEPDWEKWAREQTKGVGVDHVIEVGGAGTFEKSCRAVRTNGHIALIGVLTGAGSVNPIPILMNALRVCGIFVGSRAMFAEMNRAFALHQIKPVIDRVFPFEEAPQALRHMESGSHFGKIVIRVAK